MRRARVLLVTTMGCAVWWACTEGGDPTGAGRSAALGIVPSFQVDPALFASDPIDRIRLAALDGATRALAGSIDRSVDPSATQWSLSLAIDLADQATRTVVVEAELFSGSTVTWSGRLGPLDVPTSSPALSLDVYRGPLDNLDVVSIVVTGAPSQLVAGAAVPLTADFTLLSGSSATPVVFWASTDSTVATVTPSGSTATLTAVAAGTADIVATAGAEYFEFALEVLPPGSASKTWVGGGAGGATLWSQADNWSPTGAPTASDDVLIPATANDPVLTAAVSVNGLTVENGASLDLGSFGLQVKGDLQVPGTVTNGTVVAGGGGTVAGNMDRLFISQPRSASGTITLTGDLEMGAALTVGAQTINVGGSLTTQTGGRLVMATAGGLVNVTGDMTFAGDSEDGSLTAGQLQVLGDFTAGGSTPTSYAASGAHSVSFNGPALQTITVEQPGPAASRFNTVYVDNTGGVELATDAYVAGDVSVSSTLVVPSGLTLDIAGTLTLEAGSTLDVDGTVTAGTCTDLGGTIQGTGTQPCGVPASGATRTWVGGSSANPNDWNNAANWNPVGVPGPNDTVSVQSSAYNPYLTVDAAVASITIGGGSSVSLGGFTLTVTGDVDAGGGGTYGGLVDVTGSGSVLQGVFGDLTVHTDRTLSGQIYTGGNLEVQGAFDTNAQALTIAGDLLVSGGGTFIMTDPAAYVVVYGNATFNGGDHTNALTAGFLSVIGDFYASDVSPTSFVSSGTHELGLSGTTPTVTFDIPGPTEQRMNDVSVSVASQVTLATSAYASGDVTVNGHLIVPAGRTLTIDGTLDLATSSVLEVEGTVVVTTCNAFGVVIGNGPAACGTPIQVDRIWRGGTPGAEQSWENAANWDPVDVPKVGETIFVPYTEYGPTLSAPTSIGDLLVHTTAYLDLGGYSLTVDGDVSVQGYVIGGELQVTGTGTLLQGSIDGLRLDAPRSLTGLLSLDGSADIQARLAVGAQTLYVSGDLVTSAAGELAMDDPNSLVEVLGTTSLTGLRADLTSGILYVFGDLLMESPSSGGATVYIGGNVDQAVSLSAPGTGPGQQYFAELYVANTGGTVTLSDPTYVKGNFYGSYTTIAGSGLLEVQGGFYADSTTFSGLPVRINTTLTPAYHTLSGLTFTGYSPDVTQLFISMPGDDFNVLMMSKPDFQTVPNSGVGYYIVADNTIVGGAKLTIELTTPNPMGVAPPLYKLNDADTEIIWP